MAAHREHPWRPCQRNIERSPFSAWVHFANGARREADRERRTVRGHLLRGNIFLPRNTAQYRAMPRNRGQGSRDWEAGAAVRAAVFGVATLSYPRRTQRPFRHRICDQDTPSMRLGRSSSARSAHASCAALFDRTNAPLARHPGAAWKRRADRSRAGRVDRGGP